MPSLAEILVSLDKGWATLIAAALAALISLATLVVSTIMSRSQSKLVARLSDAANVGKEAREYKLKQLTVFYDPIYTLLAANEAVFRRIGPTSAIRREHIYSDEETADIWELLSNDVVVGNNTRICEIIQSNLHYLSAEDSDEKYLEFVTHAHAYKAFKKSAFEAYRLFHFPQGFLESVRESRNKLRADIATIYTPAKGLARWR